MGALENMSHVHARSSRERISRLYSAGIRVDQVKKCLLALLYGARVSTWHKAAIAEEIGGEAAESLIKVELFPASGQ